MKPVVRLGWSWGAVKVIRLLTWSLRKSGSQLGASVRNPWATCRWTSAASWAKLVGFMMRVPHDIIHIVASFPCRKAAIADGRRVSMTWGRMVGWLTSELDYTLTSKNRAHDSGDTKRSPDRSWE